MSEDDQSQGSRRLRKLGVFFWVFAACSAVVVPLSIVDGDFLNAGAFLALALVVVLHRTGLAERSAAWKRLYNASAIAVGLLFLLLILTDFGIL
jgi:hypothetical protein